MSQPSRSRRPRPQIKACALNPMSGKVRRAHSASDPVAVASGRSRQGAQGGLRVGRHRPPHLCRACARSAGLRRRRGLQDTAAHGQTRTEDRPARRGFLARLLAARNDRGGCGSRTTRPRRRRDLSRALADARDDLQRAEAADVQGSLNSRHGHVFDETKHDRRGAELDARVLGWSGRDLVRRARRRRRPTSATATACSAAEARQRAAVRRESPSRQWKPAVGALRVHVKGSTSYHAFLLACRPATSRGSHGARGSPRWPAARRALERRDLVEEDHAAGNARITHAALRQGGLARAGVVARAQSRSRPGRRSRRRWGARGEVQPQAPGPQEACDGRRRPVVASCATARGWPLLGVGDRDGVRGRRRGQGPTPGPAAVRGRWEPSSPFYGRRGPYARHGDFSQGPPTGNEIRSRRATRGC